VKSYAAQTAARGSAILTVDALNMMLMAGLVLLILRQVMPIAASLAGGAALSSFGLLSRTVASGLQRGRVMAVDKAKFAAPIIARSAGRVVMAGSRAGQSAYRRASESIHELRHGRRRPRP
jgi:hypothetical protein